MIKHYSIYFLNIFEINRSPISYLSLSPIIPGTWKLLNKLQRMSDTIHGFRGVYSLVKQKLFNCQSQSEMYIHIDVKYSSNLYYCYVAPFYGLWEKCNS